jgi:hypothetical protein
VDEAPLSLTDAIKASVGRLPRQRAAKSPTAPAPRRRREASLTQAMKDVASRRRNPPATRTGRKGIVIYFDQPVAAAIRRLGSDYSATNQDLGEMAFKYLFEKFGEPWPA